VHFTALTRHLDRARSPAELQAAVTADVAAAARLLRDGLGSFTAASA
jgi:hypothetical protein